MPDEIIVVEGTETHEQNAEETNGERAEEETEQLEWELIHGRLDTIDARLIELESGTISRIASLEGELAELRRLVTEWTRDERPTSSHPWFRRLVDI